MSVVPFTHDLMLESVYVFRRLGYLEQKDLAVIMRYVWRKMEGTGKITMVQMVVVWGGVNGGGGRLT